MLRSTCRFLFSILAVLGLVCSVHATPYASSVVVSGTDISFVLNESADNVTVLFDGGAVSQDLGALAKGTHTFALGGATTFQIVVKKDAAAGYTQGAIQQLSVDANPLVRFNSPRGITVNKNPSSPAFGRVFVANSAAGTTSGRTLSKGIYAVNADQSAIASLGTNGLTGGLAFAASANSPFRVTVGPDDNLYICDWSDANGSVYVTDINVANGQNVLGGPKGGTVPLGATALHGSISSVWIEGSLGTSDLTLYVIDEDLQSDPTSSTLSEVNSIWRWDIGAGPLPATTFPTRIASGLVNFASQAADLVRSTNGMYYLSQRRQNDSFDDVIVRPADSSQTLWASKAKTLEYNGAARDLLWQTVGIDLSPDGKWLAALRADNNSITLLPLLSDGLPDLTNRVVLATSPTTGDSRDIAFDAAGNLYYVSSGQGLMRVFSPGGKTTATTGSDGSFNVAVEEVPKVNIIALDSSGSEDGPDVATFVVSRTGDTSQPLTVDIGVAGTGTAGSDYPALPASITFPSGQATFEIVLTPIDDAIAELQENVSINLSFSTNYTLANPTNAVAYIGDNEPLTLRLSTTKTNMYEPLPSDTCILTVTRLGNTNGDVFGVELVVSGTATHTVDYNFSENFFSFPAQLVSSNVTFFPINDFEVESPESIMVSFGAGTADYEYDPANIVTLDLRDDDDPPARVLFADDLNTSVPENWTMRFGANNGIFDANVSWGYDYASLGIPFAPNTMDNSMTGLRLELNKTDATLGGSAGINFYPVDQSFSGDYALRFDMYLSYGTAATTEHAIAGLNHSGDLTVRATQSTDTNNTTAGGDGIWVGIVTDASNLRDYGAYTYSTPTSLPTLLTNRSASTLTDVITRPPYALAGSPGSSGSSRSWANVELSQVSGVITLKVNDAVILSLPNETPYTSGNIMIGHNDQFDSTSSANSFVIFDNVRVVSLALEITRVELLPSNQIQIDFSSPNGEPASAFALQSRPALGTGAWAADAAAVITSLGGGSYRAVTTRSGGERYYQIGK